MVRPRIASSPAYRWGATALFLAAAVIVAALGFEHIGRMTPCPLCLQQRWAYYAGIPATFLALVLLSAGHPRAAALVFGLVALAFLANAGLGGYHAGVEWGFWAGPDTCATPAPQSIPSGGNFLETLKNTPRIVRCDEAAWRFAGLSFAGWNVIASLMLCTAAAKASLASREHEIYL
jgi:disulfide bond formation protein DsbB